MSTIAEDFKRAQREISQSRAYSLCVGQTFMETFTKSLTLPIWQVVGLCVGTAAAISSAAYYVRSKRDTSKVIPPRKKGEQGRLSRWIARTRSMNLMGRQCSTR